MTPRPKIFTANVTFSVAGQRFVAGDRVEGIALRNVLRYGDRFVSVKKKTTTTQPITPEPTPTPDEVGTEQENPS